MNLPCPMESLNQLPFKNVELGTYDTRHKRRSYPRGGIGSNTSLGKRSSRSKFYEEDGENSLDNRPSVDLYHLS